MLDNLFLPCNAMHKRDLCRHVVSVCLSVRPSHSCILSKRINVSSKFFLPPNSHTILDFPYQTSLQYSDKDLLTGASNAGGVGTNQDSWLICGYWSTAAVRTTTVTILCAIYRTDHHASVNLCLSQPACMATMKRREQTRIYLYAAVNLKWK